MKNMECTKCGGSAEGYKCDQCGAESGNHDGGHGCGGEHCMPKCSGCDEAQANCSCM